MLVEGEWDGAEQILIDNVINKTSLVVYAEIKNHSERSHKNPNESRDDYWTDLEIIKSLHGVANTNSLRLIAWQAYAYPTFVYKKGQRAIFFLSKENDKYQLTDTNWAYCVPSIITEEDDKTFRLQYAYDRISLDSISKIIQDLFAKSS